MGGLFGGSGDSDAAKQAAAAAKRAEQRELQRQADIKAAIANIDNVFSEQGTLTGYAQGDPLSALPQRLTGAYYNPSGTMWEYTRPSMDWSSSKDGSSLDPTGGVDLAAFNQWAGLPANYHQWTPPSTSTDLWGSYTPANAPAWYTYQDPNIFTGQTEGTWRFNQDAYIRAQLDAMAKAGKLYGATPQYSGGFNDAFYNAKAQSYLDYYQPQLQEQYDKAKEQLTYGLANAGLLRSSAANKENADLFKQNQYQQVGLSQQAQAEATKLRQQVAGEKASLISQAVATADPDLAANQAAIASTTLRKPNNDYDALGEVFKNAIIGGGNYYMGYNQGNMAAKYPVPNVLGGGSATTYSGR
jgi:hypothetical protein